MDVCLAVPCKVVEIDKEKEHAMVDYGDLSVKKAGNSKVYFLNKR